MRTRKHMHTHTQADRRESPVSPSFLTPSRPHHSPPLPAWASVLCLLRLSQLVQLSSDYQLFYDAPQVRGHGLGVSGQRLGIMSEGLRVEFEHLSRTVLQTAHVALDSNPRRYTALT